MAAWPDLVSFCLVLQLCHLFFSVTALECKEGEMEWEGRCESCETAVLAGWATGKNSCPQCPDVTKRGLHCDVSCSDYCPEGCERWTGKCHGCRRDHVLGTGRHGNTCQHTCGYHCKNQTCVQDNGTCLEGCTEGHFGIYCRDECPSTCLCEKGQKTCKTPPCSMEGHCTFGCMESYYGENCSIPCPAGCSSNSCTREGKCHACTQGSYGDQCQLLCSGHCTDKQCHQHTGVCSHGCEAGFWGDTCVSACPDSCVNCTNSTDCFLCKDGWYGTACQHRCRGHCRGGCDDSDVCKQCKDGFYGVDCNKACNQNCVSLTDGPGVCNRSSGHCLHSCKNGFFGLWCDAECSDHCVDRTCQGQFPEYGGTCVKGCKDGYRGVYCQVPCPDHCQTCSQRDVGCGQCQDGWYGSVCQERCQNCSGPCEDTGKCATTLTTTSGPSSLDMEVFIIALSIVLLVSLGVIVTATTFIARRRCRRTRQSTEHAEAGANVYMMTHMFKTRTIRTSVTDS